MKQGQQNQHLIKQKLDQLKTKNIAGGLVDGVASMMQANIREGNIMIPAQKSSLPIQRKVQKCQGEESQNKLGDVLAKKEMIQKQLQAVMRQEEAIKMARLTQSKAPVEKQYFKSEFTQDDLEKIKKIKAKQKKFEKQLQQKTQQYQQRMKKIKMEEQLAKQRERKQKYELKKQQIEKTIEVIQKRKSQRSLRIQNEKKAVKQILGRKKLHEELQQKWRIVQQQEQKKKQQLKQELRKLRKVTHQQIKEHEKKYQQTMRVQKQSRMKQSTNVGFDYAGPYRSVFLEQIRQEEKKQKEIVQDRESRPKEFLSKIKQYGEKVKAYHKPTVKPKQETHQTEDKQKQSEARSMSLFETHQKGNQYMRSANHQVVQALKKVDPNTLPINRQSQEQPRYKNYLKQLKKHDGQQNNKKTSEITTIRSILKKENLTSEQKFCQAKILADRMDYMTVVKSPQRMVNSINTKIEILKQLDI